MNPTSKAARPHRLACFALLFLLLMVVGPSRMFRDPGTLWHTVAGRQVLDSGELNRHDQWTFSHAGQPWIDQQWLGGCIMAVVDRLAGLDGLLALAATVIAATFAALHARLRNSGCGHLKSVILIGLALAASSHHFVIRPHLASMALLVPTCILLCDVDAGRAPPQRLLWLGPLLILWTNLHGGALGGLVTVLIIIFGWALLPSARPPGIGARRLVLVAALTTPAVLVSPYGPSLPRVWLSLMGDPLLSAMIVEHAPMNLLSVEMAAVLLLAGCYAVLIYRTGGANLRLTSLLPIPWLLLALARARHAPLFAIVTLIVIAEFSRREALPKTSRWLPRLAPVAMLAAVLMLQAGGSRLPLLGAGRVTLDPAYWPVETTRVISTALEETPSSARVFNDMLFGGYLVYAVPRARPFIDDRCELHGNAGLRRYAEISAQPQLLIGLAHQQDIHWAMVKRGNRLDRYLAADPGWRRIHQDAAASLYKRKG